MARFKAHRTLTLMLSAIALVAGPLMADSGANHQQKLPLPIELGVSGSSATDISKAFCCGGTFGSAVLYDGALHILSNNHIIARAGSATVPDNDIQPGLIDVSCQASGANVVGQFIGNVVPLGSGIGGTNVDAALSRAASGAVRTDGFIMDIGVPCSTPQAAVVNQPVVKSGRTTGCLGGMVTSVNTSVSIKYQAGCNQGKKFTINYTNQVVTTAISAGGDSGSLILTQAGLHPTALLYAGSSTSTVGNPAGDVINAFQAGGHTFSWVGTGSCNNLSCTTCNQAGGFTCTGNAAASLPAPVPSGASAAAPAWAHPSESEVDIARRVKEAHEPELFSRTGVIGVGVGATEADATKAAIVIYLETGQNALHRGLPSEIDGVPVRIIPTDPFVAF
jgi:hypothetical protein